MSYARFKRAVLDAAGWQCEVPGCDSSENLTVHHFLKQSTWPQYAEDPDNGMAVDGKDHSEIERRIREGEDFVEMYPIGRYRAMLAKAGIDVPEGMEPPARARKARVLEARAAEVRAGQGFLPLEGEA